MSPRRGADKHAINVNTNVTNAQEAKPREHGNENVTGRGAKLFTGSARRTRRRNTTTEITYRHSGP